MQTQPRIMEAYAGNTFSARAQLAEIETPAALGRFHQPISFADYTDEVEEQLDRVGLQVVTEEHCVTHEGLRHFGVLELAPGPTLEGEVIMADDWRLFMALRGSHDQSVQRGLALGRHVSICTNMSIFSGDLGQMSTKQTTNIMQRLPGLIYNAVAQVPEMAVLETRRVDRMKEFGLRARQGDMLLVEALRRNIVTGAQLSRAVSEWDRPTHDEFAENGFTAWRLEQAVTEAVKPANVEHGNPHLIHTRTQGFTTLMHELMEAS